MKIDLKKNLLCNPMAYLVAVILFIPFQTWAVLNLLLSQQRAWADMLTSYIRTSKFEPNFQAGDPSLLSATFLIDCIFLVVSAVLFARQRRREASAPTGCEAATCQRQAVIA